MNGMENDIDQYFKIEGTSWFTPTGAYAEFDYIHVIPIPEESFINNAENFLANCFGDEILNSISAISKIAISILVISCASSKLNSFNADTSNFIPSASIDASTGKRGISVSSNSL